jgi:hypothetical protein
MCVLVRKEGGAMAKRVTTKERRERQQREVEALRQAVERARGKWLGKIVTFVDDLDEKTKVGRVVSIADSGGVCIVFQLIPGRLDCPCERYTGIEELEELCTLVDVK